MQAYTMTAAGVEPGISIALATAERPFPGIVLGEDGRGRKLTVIPVGRQHQDRAALDAAWAEYQAASSAYRAAPGVAPYPLKPSIARMRSASLVVGKAGGPVLTAASAGDVDALVAVRVPAGYRGSTTLMGAGPVPCPRRGTTLRLVETDDAVPGTLRCPWCLVPLDGGEWHPDAGDDVGEFPRDQIIAKGHCADGGAGRMGGHAEYLLRLRPGDMIAVRRSGRLYGAASHCFATWDGRKMRFSHDRDIALASVGVGAAPDAE